jgi:DNA-binding NarL/FixJ family response regulator
MTAVKSTTKEIEVLIIDDHKMIRDGIKVMLKAKNKFYNFNITEADCGEVAREKSMQKAFDLAIVDCQMPGIQGDETISDIKLNSPETRFLALSNYDEVSYVKKMLGAGAMGYILKNIEPYQLITAIKNVLNDNPYYSNEVALKLIEEERRSKRVTFSDRNKLTEREVQVLKLISSEKTNEEIALQLNLSKRTIDSHRQNLLHKLGVKNGAGLAKMAYELNII